MAERLALGYAGAVYLDRTAPLASREVEPEGIELSFAEAPDLNDLFRSQAAELPFDVAELSLATYMAMRSRGDDRLIALPVFPLRHYRHRQIYVHAGAGIERPADLRGRDVGVLEYQMTAAVWVRGFLQHDYGVLPQEIRWWAGGLRTPGYEPRSAHRPPGVSIDTIPGDRTLEGMLAEGALDALVSVQPPERFGDPALPVRRLFGDYRAVEREYGRRTGLFPIMHVVGMRRELDEREPWVAAALVGAFERARALGRRRLGDLDRLAVGLPWLEGELEEVERLFGGDPFRYGIEPNRPELEALAGYLHEQGLAARRVAVEELFSANLAAA